MFKTILIANRGEIALRIARTAKAMGIRTVAVCSDADRDAPHARACDAAVRLGPAPASESYLKGDAVIAAAKATGAEAIHPGYGFLSENAAFAEAVEAAGLVFIGPTAKTIRAMGSKSAAKDLMEAAGVPTTPGYQGDDQSPERFRAEAARIGYPVLLKASAGGGGKGMRRVDAEPDLEAALASARREAQSAFGDDRFLIEKYVAKARHVEVQIFGDGAGRVVHAFERDCSVQRRHQKIIEEAPAPAMPDDVRARLLQAGVEAGRAVDYRGAGTVEFLYDADAGAVYFMEMNTRLQVEHPVSEMITGLDFVEWQLRIAAGEGLPLDQAAITACGHAVEARLYAEDPAQNFAPSVGVLTTLRLPGEAARVDSGVVEGQTITPYYDPMIAKVIVAGGDRAEALARLRAALGETRVAGLETNAAFLARLAGHDAFIAGAVSTRFIEEHEETLFAPGAEPRAALAAVLAMGIADRATAGDKTDDDAGADPWDALFGFRLNEPQSAAFWLALDGAPALATVTAHGAGYAARVETGADADARKTGDSEAKTIDFTFSYAAEDGATFRIRMEDRDVDAFVAPHKDGVRVFIGAEHYDIGAADPLSGAAARHVSEGSLTAPMPGVVTMLAAAPGEAVKAGAPLLVMEAMKMEHAIKAPFDGTVVAYRFAAGDQVREGDLLLDFEETP